MTLFQTKGLNYFEKSAFLVEICPLAAKNATFQDKRSIFQEAHLLFLSNDPGGTFIPGGTVIHDPSVAYLKALTSILGFSSH